MYSLLDLIQIDTKIIFCFIWRSVKILLLWKHRGTSDILNFFVNPQLKFKVGITEYLNKTTVTLLLLNKAFFKNSHCTIDIYNIYLKNFELILSPILCFCILYHITIRKMFFICYDIYLFQWGSSKRPTSFGNTLKITF